MSSAQFFNLATVIYFQAMVLLALFLVLRDWRPASLKMSSARMLFLGGRIGKRFVPLLRQFGFGTLAITSVWFGFAAHSVAIGLRWIESYRLPGAIGHAPLSNLYESVIFFAWSIVLIYLIIDLRLRQRAVGAFVVPFALLAMCWAQLRGNDVIEPLVPALQSNWLTYHVVTCFFGYAAFALGCAVSIMYLVKSASVASKPADTGDLLPSMEVLDALNYKAIMIGFPFLTLGIVTGAAWANYAWGTYWSWDPKETWSLIVWFIYAAFLHARLTRGWSGRRAAWLSILGFAATLFCYLGVNLIQAIGGLHSYGGG